MFLYSLFGAKIWLSKFAKIKEPGTDYTNFEGSKGHGVSYKNNKLSMYYFICLPRIPDSLSLGFERLPTFHTTKFDGVVDKLFFHWLLDAPLSCRRDLLAVPDVCGYGIFRAKTTEGVLKCVEAGKFIPNL